MQVSTADLALVLGITERRIQQLENLGVFAKLEHGEWALPEAVQAYLRHRLKTKPRSPSGGGKADEKLKTAKAAREELRLARDRAELIPVDEAVGIIDEAIGTLRADLAGIPARLTRDMTLREKIETEIDGALNRCADRFAERADSLAPAVEPLASATEDDAGPMGGGEP